MAFALAWTSGFLIGASLTAFFYTHRRLSDTDFHRIMRGIEHLFERPVRLD